MLSETEPVWEISKQNSMVIFPTTITEEKLQKYLLDLIIAPEMRLLLGRDFIMGDEN